MPFPVFQTLQASAVAQAVAKSNHLVGAGLQVLHIGGFLLVLTAVVLLNLRALGLILRGQRLAMVCAEAQRLLWLGIGIALVSGVLIFLASAIRYSGNAAFDLKIGLLLIAVPTQLVIQRRIFAAEGRRPAALRAAALVSLALWFCIAIAGRAIGYV
jgi:hypothetical protein